MKSILTLIPAKLRRAVRSRVLPPVIGVGRTLLGGAAPPLILRTHRLAGHHVFAGYYDAQPGSSDGRRLLVHAAQVPLGPKLAGAAAKIGWVPRAGGEFVEVGVTTLWCWQIGARAVWLVDGAVGFNAIVSGQAGFCRSGDDGRTELLVPWPLFAVNPQAGLGLTLNFGRLATARPGYGYPDIADPFAGAALPMHDGLGVVDLARGEIAAFVTLPEIAAATRSAGETALHYLNGASLSPAGSAFSVLHKRINSKDTARWRVDLVIGRTDGSGVRRVALPGPPSHYRWIDETRIALTVRAGPMPWSYRYLLHDCATGMLRSLHSDAPKVDGHPGLHASSGRWITDSYPDLGGLQSLWTLEPNGQRRLLGRLSVGRGHVGEWRCDLHPRWLPEGESVLIDSSHEGLRLIAEVAAAPGSGS